jgi:carboxyl-terminal processing protease
MKRLGLWAIAILLVVGVQSGKSQSVSPQADTALTDKAVFGKQAKVISYILDNNHYRKLHLNDSLSSAILDAYILALDNSKIYFLASDIASFEKYRYKIDDLTKLEDTSPAFVIYRVFKTRFDQRMKYVMNTLISAEFDFTKDEYYETNRDKAPWPKTTQELDAAWTKIIKNYALSLKLAGKKKEEITETLKGRYERYIKSIEQTNSGDVFGIYMNTIAEAYDPHTNYLSPSATDRFNQDISQSLEGIGARLQTDNDYTKVNEILPGGPAEKSNLIHVNDRIVGVAQGDGEMVDVIGWRIDDVVKLIKGPKGTRVRLQILPAESGVNGPPVTISLIRDKIKLEDLTAKKKVIEYLQNGRPVKLGVITLPSFYMDFASYQKGDPNYNSTTRDVKKYIGELQAEGVQGIAIDLRNNGGGSLQEAINLTGLFIKNGPVVQVKSSNNRVEVLTDDNSEIAYNGPLVVLINRFSASASEIFAGAIQDYHRGVIVGESTYGKGTVQQVVPLDRYVNETDDVGSLKLTLQKFYRATGSSTQHKGVIPDIKFPTALDPEQFGESSQANALPWDEIKGTLYQRTPIINDKVLAELKRAHQERSKNDPYLTRFIDETNETRKSIAHTNISLNESVRRKEMDEAERKRAANNKLGTTTVDKEGKPLSGTLNIDDEYLREGLLVLSNLITSKIG